MSSRILQSKGKSVDKRKYESDNDDDDYDETTTQQHKKKNKKNEDYDNISNQKRKASKENNCIYNHKIQLFEDLKKIFEFTNVDNSSGFAFYRNFQDKRKECVKEIKRLCEENSDLGKKLMN
ncbi:hypothetical protein F8M41_018184 [Gigaspora margarita]|uniref:Uncharacterized protein n=1 Tax=Gigaspora margarita TaxID=4874 RepID=A0A8H3WWH2_GIGMA|nr:hypothetical protein F8M41_018184 [Gigaspora margarita]